LLGALIGFLLDTGNRFFNKNDDKLVMTMGAILVASGIAIHFNLSLILTNMVVGLYVTNSHPQRNESVFELIKASAPPLYIIFFILIGVRLQVGLLPKMGMIGLLYVAGRTAGKWTGSYFGARVSGSPDAVRKYLGFALFSQAGVALGLTLDIFHNLSAYGPKGQNVGYTVINVIAATTFLVQIIGPPFVKFAISRAGEITLNKETGE
jgi:Kef-type K+ transport system membrane component KefB